MAAEIILAVTRYEVQAKYCSVQPGRRQRHQL